MTARRPVTVIVIGLALVATWVTAIPAGAAKVSVPQYVKSVCTAITDYQSTIGDAQSEFEDAVSGEDDPAVAKQEIIAFFDDFVAATRQLGTDLRAAGTPQVENGGKLAGVLRAGIARMQSIVADAREDASDLSTSPRKFVKQAQKLSKSMQDAFDEVGESFDEIDEKYGSEAFDEAGDNEPACAVLNGSSATGS
jgi:hypothetical protein